MVEQLNTSTVRVGTLNGSGCFRQDEGYGYAITAIDKVMHERKLNVMILTEVSIKDKPQHDQLIKAIKEHGMDCRLGDSHGPGHSKIGVVVLWIPAENEGGFPFDAVEYMIKPGGRGIAVHFRSRTRGGVNY